MCSRLRPSVFAGFLWISDFFIFKFEPFMKPRSQVCSRHSALMIIETIMCLFGLCEQMMFVLMTVVKLSSIILSHFTHF